MKLIDTHIHVANLSAKELKSLIQNDKIAKFICVSSISSDWPKIASLYEEYPDKIVPAFGLHPWYLADAPDGWDKELEQYLIKYPSALVGEIGLDRHKNPNEEPQFSAFRIQLKLAQNHRRAVLIHNVKSQDWLEHFWADMPPKFVIHSYSGKADFLKRIVSKGGYISFSPSILKGGKEDVINAVPADKLLIESDAPFQGAVDSTVLLCDELSIIRKEDVSEITRNNALEIIKGG
jgi:TatD DNase family protein